MWALMNTIFSTSGSAATFEKQTAKASNKTAEFIDMVKLWRSLLDGRSVFFPSPNVTNAFMWNARGAHTVEIRVVNFFSFPTWFFYWRSMFVTVTILIFVSFLNKYNIEFKSMVRDQVEVRSKYFMSSIHLRFEILTGFKLKRTNAEKKRLEAF